MALWIQVVSAKLFGFSGLSVLVPQVVEGVVAIVLVSYFVQRRFGPLAGLLAALFLTLTPISVAIDRSSNTDSCLVLVLLLAAWALTRATEVGRWRLLLLSMALVGVGFNVKMLAAFVVLPTFAGIYCVGAPIAWRRRLSHLATAAVVLAAVSLSWIVAYDLTPPESRPVRSKVARLSRVRLSAAARETRCSSWPLATMALSGSYGAGAGLRGPLAENPLATASPGVLTAARATSLSSRTLQAARTTQRWHCPHRREPRRVPILVPQGEQAVLRAHGPVSRSRWR